MKKIVESFPFWTSEIRQKKHPWIKLKTMLLTPQQNPQLLTMCVRVNAEVKLSSQWIQSAHTRGSKLGGKGDETSAWSLAAPIQSVPSRPGRKIRMLKVLQGGISDTERKKQPQISSALRISECMYMWFFSKASSIRTGGTVERQRCENGYKKHSANKESFTEGKQKI